MDYSPIKTGLKEYGNLFIYEIIDKIDYPMVFTCINAKKDKFLFYYADSGKNWCKWVVIKLNKRDNDSLFSSKISVRNIFYDCFPKNGNIIQYDFDEQTCKIIEGENIDSYICDPEYDFYVDSKNIQVVNEKVVNNFDYFYNLLEKHKSDNSMMLDRDLYIKRGFKKNDRHYVNVIYANDVSIDVLLSNNQVNRIKKNPEFKFLIIPDFTTFTPNIDKSVKVKKLDYKRANSNGSMKEKKFNKADLYIATMGCRLVLKKK